MFLFHEQIKGDCQMVDEYNSRPNVLTPEIIPSSDLPQQAKAITKKNKNWAVCIITNIVQTLEDICINIPQPEVILASQFLHEELTNLHSSILCHESIWNITTACLT